MVSGELSEVVMVALSMKRDFLKVNRVQFDLDVVIIIRNMEYGYDTCIRIYLLVQICHLSFTILNNLKPLKHT